MREGRRRNRFLRKHWQIDRQRTSELGMFGRKSGEKEQSF